MRIPFFKKKPEPFEKPESRGAIPNDAVLVGKCRRCGAGLYVQKKDKRMYMKVLADKKKSSIFDCRRCGNRQSEKFGWNTLDQIGKVKK